MNSERKILNDFQKLLEDQLGKEKAVELRKKVLSAYFDEKNKRKSKDEADQYHVDSFRVRSFVDRIVTYTDKTLTSKQHLNLLLNLAELSLTKGELFLSSDLYSQVLFKTIKSEKYEEERAFAFVGLGEISSNQAKWEESFSYIRKAKKMFENSQNYRGIAKCENLLGTFYAERGVLKTAKSYYESGLENLKGRKSNNLDAIILVNLGILNNIIGELEEAQKNYNKALLKFEKSNDMKRIAQTRHNLGMLFSNMGDFKKAIKQFNVSIAVSTEDQNLLTLAISFLSKAYIYSELGDLDLAASYIEKGMILSNQLNDRLTIADIYKVKGIVERRRKNFDLAESFLLTSLRINGELGNRLNHAETSYELGILYRDMSKSQKSKERFKEALKYYKKIGAVSKIAKIESLLQN